jgi:hypothetical protein
MKPVLFSLFLVLLFACSNNRENNTASPGALHTGNSAADTSKLITDSVRIRDTNATDIEAMKKIN